MRDYKRPGFFTPSDADRELPPDRCCIHCNRPIPWGEGHVDEEVSLCDYCLHND